MSRYIQGDYRQPPKPEKAPKPRVITPVGTHNSESLASIKTITTPNSGAI